MPTAKRSHIYMVARRKGALPTLRFCDPETARMNSPPERTDSSVDRKLLEILVCPVTKGPLEFDSARQELISRSAKLAYPIRDGIPDHAAGGSEEDRVSSSFRDAPLGASPESILPAPTCES